MMKRRYHIIVDGWDVDPKLISNSLLIKEVVHKLVKLCDMKILHGPVLVEGVPANPGLTCFSIIDFSHISIHTFTKSKEICVDVFSCKKYDYEKVKNFICETFKIDPKCMIYKEVQYD